MKIVIDIPDGIYQDIESRDWKNTIWARDSLMRYIHEGVVLPKHHGRLIDADEFQMKCFRRNFSNQIDNHEMADINMLLHLSPTIIPAEEVQE